MLKREVQQYFSLKKIEIFSTSNTVDPRLLPLGNPVKYHVPGSGFVFKAYVIVYFKEKSERT